MPQGPGIRQWATVTSYFLFLFFFFLGSCIVPLTCTIEDGYISMSLKDTCTLLEMSVTGNNIAMSCSLISCTSLHILPLHLST